MQVRFISKDGSRFLKDISEPLPAKYEIERDDDPQAYPVIDKLARAIFDKKLSIEATRIGDGNPQRILDIMWNTTKPDDRLSAETEALALTVLMSNGHREFRLFKSRGGGQCYIEIGTVFNDLTLCDAPAPIQPAVSRRIESMLGWQDQLPEPITEETLGNREIDGSRFFGIAVNKSQPGSNEEKTAAEQRVRDRVKIWYDLGK